MVKSILRMAGELLNALTKLSEVIAELNTDQEAIDSLNSQLAIVQAAKDADDVLLAQEAILDKKESVLDYLRGKGRAIREGALIINASYQERFNVPLAYVDGTPELLLVMQGYANAGFAYSVITL